MEVGRSPSRRSACPVIERRPRRRRGGARRAGRPGALGRGAYRAHVDVADVRGPRAQRAPPRPHDGRLPARLGLADRCSALRGLARAQPPPAAPLPHGLDPDRGRPCEERDADLGAARRLPRGGQPPRPRRRSALRGAEGQDRGGLPRARLPLPAALPQRPEPHRADRRHERRSPLRSTLRSPDRRLRAAPRRRHRGRRQEAQRDPGRPCRRRPAGELHDPVLGLQQHLRARDGGLSHPQRHHALESGVRRPVVHVPGGALREDRRLRARRLRGLSGLGLPGEGLRASVRDLRHRDPRGRLPRQQPGLLGHRGQQRLGARLEVPRQRDRPGDRLVRGRPPRHAAALREMGGQRDLRQQRQRLLGQAPGLLRPSRWTSGA